MNLSLRSSALLFNSLKKLKAEECLRHSRLRWIVRVHNNQHRSFSSSDFIHQHQHDYWKNIAERSITFIQKMENHAIHPGVVHQNIYGLLVDCAHCPFEAGTDIKELGPIAAKLLELAVAGRSTNNEDKGKTVTSKPQLASKSSECTVDAVDKAELYDLAIKTWLRSKHPDALKQAEKLLWDILSDTDIIHCNDENITNFVNDAFAKVLHASANTLEHKAVLSEDTTSRIQRFIDTMQKYWEDPNTLLTGNTTAMNGILNVLCKRGVPANALTLLKGMAERQDSGENHVAPNNISYGIVISSFAKSGNVEAAQAVLDWMTTRHAKDSNNCPKPTRVEYTSLLDAWANSGKPDAGAEADKLLLWMMEQDDEKIQPNAMSYSIAIHAWAKTTKGHAAERAEKILRHMIQKQEQGLEIDVETMMVSFSTVVDAWSRSNHPEATKRAAAIVDYMERLDHPGLAPNERTYASLIKAWASKADKEGGSMALLVWRRMLERGVQPRNPQTFNSLLQALIQSGPSGASDAFDRFLQADSEHQSWQLDTVSFNTALNALTKCTRADAVDLGDSLLARMIQYEESDQGCGKRIQPNTITFNTFMSLLLKHATQESDPAEEIQHLLDEMEESSSSRPSRQPDLITYALCLRAWAQSSNEKKLRHARDVLNRLERAYERGNLSAKPTTDAYNTVIYACRFPVLSERTTGAMASELAIETFNRLRQLKYAEPDEMTYSNLLQVLARHSAPGTKRETLIEEVFLSCCQDGLVGNAVLRELRYASSFVYDKLVSFHLSATTTTSGGKASLPEEWQRKIKLVNSRTKGRVPT